MAKWGCGDPRWIVEERSDAKNVNNWHWTEKDASSWSNCKLKELLTDIYIENDTAAIKVGDITKMEGEATANNRKSKLIFFYEWNIVADWTGFYKPDKSKVKGSLEILNLSEEHEPKDVDIDISLKTSDTDNKDSTEPNLDVNIKCSEESKDKLKHIMQTQGVKEIRKVIGEYIRQLKEEFSKDIILPTNKKIEVNADNDNIKNSQNIKKHISVAHSILDKDDENIDKINHGQEVNLQMFKTKKLIQNENFNTTPEELFSILTDINKVQAFTRNPVNQYEVHPGGGFSLLGQNITGTFMEIDPSSLKLTCKWRLSFWPQGHFSVVVIEIKGGSDGQGGGAALKITQTEIPEVYYDTTSQGWYRYYWKPIRDTFGI